MKQADIERFLEKGRQVELAFAELAISKGYSVELATKDQDRYEHWDLRITNPCAQEVWTTDVKGLKKISRQDNDTNGAWTWIELQGKWGKGWLYGGNATHITFEGVTDWIVVDRQVLCNWINWRVKRERVVREHAQYRVYDRHGGKDLLTLVKLDDLRELGESWAKEEV